jgi:hypothetical protein
MKTLKPILPLFLCFGVAASLPAPAQSPVQPQNGTVAANTTSDRAPAASSTVAPGPPRIIYTFSHPQLQPANYTITVDETGDGRFVSQPGNAPVDRNEDVYPAPMDRKIHLDDSLRDELFSYARTHGYFAGPCERTGKLAFTGNKTLSYSGADGHGSCAFIWAADPALQRLSDQMEAVAVTLEIGRRLDVEIRHDRLGLDAELQTLQDAVKNQRASGLPNIAPELRTIAADQQVMDRARKRALTLLSSCEAAPKAN